MTTSSLSANPAVEIAADALVVAIASTDKGPVLVPGSDTGTQTRRALAGLGPTLVSLGATGAADEVFLLPAPTGVAAGLLVATGIGKRSRRYDAERLRRAAGAAARALPGRGKVVLALPAGTPEEVEAVTQGALLGGYTFHRFRHMSAEKAKPGPGAFVVATESAADRPVKRALSHAQAVADAVAFARDLVNTPPSHLVPAHFADLAADAARRAGLAVTVLDEQALRKGGYGGILGVGQGSANPPRLVRIEYRHPKASRHLALVGKGITFDTGGISIKPAQGMEAMKSDMGGAAAVVAAMTAIARVKPAVDVTGWAPMAENMPSGTAQRPSDVLTTYGGRTVEVLNTDAEGRLILADALVAAGAEDPDLVVDAATLTGAQVVALGARTSAVMSNDDAVRTKVHDAATRAGEAMWPMPLPEELRKGLDSAVADIANLDWARQGGMLSAGVFLAEFVKPGLRWAHLDIAGPAFNSGQPYGYTPKGGTGAAVRTFVQLAEDLADGRI
ncbi:MAG: leucyl aminopeptidase [Actinomycetia bacterium]|nr:leucyl aminopeptidase [Actinomycetes bacterium]